VKLSAVWASYGQQTAALTELARKLGFAAAGICWVLKDQDKLPALALVALGCTAAYFAADIAQHLCSAWRKKLLAERAEAGHFVATGRAAPEDLDVTVTQAFDHPVYYIFLLKIFLLLTAYIFIGLQVLRRLL